MTTPKNRLSPIQAALHQAAEPSVTSCGARREGRKTPRSAASTARTIKAKSTHTHELTCIATPDSKGSHRQRIQRVFVYIAEAPLLSGLQRADDRVARGVKMLGRVLVLGRVAAADVAAAHAQAQVHPGIAHRQALLAALRAGRDGLHALQMLAGHVQLRLGDTIRNSCQGVRRNWHGVAYGVPETLYTN